MSAGILAWLVIGCLQWQKIGLSIPYLIKAATKEYQKNEDTLQQFIDEVCKLGLTLEIQASTILQEYKQWCQDNKVHPLEQLNRNTFSYQMEKRFVKVKNSLYMYQGIGI